MKLESCIWRPVAYHGLHARVRRHAAILHTNGGGTGPNGSLFGWWSSTAASGSTIGAHVQVARDGRAEQYVDTDLVVYHAFSGSEFAIGIETEDDGHPTTPWTDAQISKIVQILRELQVPAQMLVDGPSDGVGYHQEFWHWNEHGHNCPGPVRVPQIAARILPALHAAGSQPPSSDGYPGWLIRLGSHGTNVLRVKERLAALGYHDRFGYSIDQAFGTRLAAAVRAFQQSKHLTADGIVGPKTWAVMFS